MSVEAFESPKLQAKTLNVIEQANAIIAEYQAMGFTLTLRQLYYQFVARDLIANAITEYKRLGTIIKSGRRAGLIDWDAIEDRTRNVRSMPWWPDPSKIVDAASRQYREDLWLGQTFRPEIWIEKDALIGVIENVCEEFRTPYFACRGNTSESELYAAAKRFARHREEGLIPLVLHLGDHDPNGLDMTRDNRDRLALFARGDVELRRLALNMDQVSQYGPPPNPAKETDSRFAGYAEQFGTDCWELDALSPDVIAGLVRTELEDLIDAEAWNSAMAGESGSRAVLTDAAENWAFGRKLSARPAMSHELAAYRRLQALAESRVLGVADPAMDRVLRRMKDAMIREALRCIAAIERLPAAKDRELALEQRAKRASEVEFLRALIVELGNTMQ